MEEALEVLYEWATLLWRMCIHTRGAMREVIENDPAYGQKELMAAMIVFAGVTPLYQGFAMMTLNLAANAIIDLIIIYLTAFTLWLAGKLMKGKASLLEVCTMTVWSSAPVILISAIGVPLSILGPGVFELGSTSPLTFFGLPFSVFDWIQLGCILWSCEVCLQANAEVQGFDLKQSALNLTLGGVFMVIPLIPPAIILGGMIASLMNRASF